MTLNLFNNRLTNKIIMPEGISTMCIVNCTNKDLYMMNVRGEKIEKLKPIEEIIDGEKINLNWADKIAYGWLISKYFINGLPQHCDDTIKVFAIHQTIVSSSMEKDKVVRDFSLVASYDVNKQVWKDANYIPIVEMNTVVSFNYEFLEQMLLQFESSGEGVLSMIEGKLTQYDGLVTNLINCSENDYYTVVEQQIIPVPGINSYDWFTHGSESQFGLDDEYREEASAKWKDSIMKEFGLTKQQIRPEHDVFISVTASHDYPRRKMTLRNLPKDKTYQKVIYQVKRVLEKNIEEYMRPFFVAGSNLPIFRSKKAAEVYLQVFKGKISLYHSAQGSITIKRLADYKIDLMRGKYVRKESSVVKTAKRFVISSFLDKSFELACQGIMKFIDFLLGKGSKAAKKASKAAFAGKSFYKMSSTMFSAGLIGAGNYSFDNDGLSERMSPRKETPINGKAKATDDFGHFVAKTPGSYREKEKQTEKLFNFDRELQKVEEQEMTFDEYQADIDGDRYYDLNGIPIDNFTSLLDYAYDRKRMSKEGTILCSNEIDDMHRAGFMRFRDKRKGGKLTYVPYRKDLETEYRDHIHYCDVIDYEKLEDYKTKFTNSKATVYIIDFDKVQHINNEMNEVYKEIIDIKRDINKTLTDEAKNILNKELLKTYRTKFAYLRNQRDDVIMKGCPDYVFLRQHVMKNGVDEGEEFMDAGKIENIASAFKEYVVPKDHPYLNPKDYVSATPSYKEIVNERINLDNDSDERWQSDRLEMEESYEEDRLSAKRTGKKGFFGRIWSGIKGIWQSRPAKVIRRVVGLGLAVVGIWKAINKWKYLAEAVALVSVICL